jgi:hypothetical protein
MRFPIAEGAITTEKKLVPSLDWGIVLSNGMVVVPVRVVWDTVVCVLTTEPEPPVAGAR